MKIRTIFAFTVGDDEEDDQQIFITDYKIAYFVEFSLFYTIIINGKKFHSLLTL